MTNSPTSLLDFIRRRVGVGELVHQRVDWLPLRSHFEFVFTIETNRNKITRYIFVQLPTFPEESRMSLLNSLPSSTRNSLLGCRMPHLKAMDLAVFTLSPVTMRTTIPARWHFKIASGTWKYSTMGQFLWRLHAKRTRNLIKTTVVMKKDFTIAKHSKQN